MALPQAGRRDADEPPVRLQLGDAARPAVAHRLTQPADELVQHVGQRALVGHTPFDALGYHLPALDRALEVTVLRERAALHGAERAHAPVLLEAFTSVHDDVARRLVDTGEGIADHHRVGAGSER